MLIWNVTVCLCMHLLWHLIYWPTCLNIDLRCRFCANIHGLKWPEIITFIWMKYVFSSQTWMQFLFFMKANDNGKNVMKSVPGVQINELFKCQRRKASRYFFNYSKKKFYFATKVLYSVFYSIEWGAKM